MVSAPATACEQRLLVILLDKAATSYGMPPDAHGQRNRGEPARHVGPARLDLPIMTDLAIMTGEASASCGA
jgi:hypothetical protein